MLRIWFLSGDTLMDTLMAQQRERAKADATARKSGFAATTAYRDVLERALPGLLEKAHLTEGIELVEVDEISRGGCMVSTVEGSVDARIETQLERITEALLPGDQS